MKKTSIIFLQVVIVALGIGTFAFMLWEPHAEGVNTNATTLYEIYFDDPFLAYAYTALIAFFVALYQAFKLLGYIAQNEVFSQSSVKVLRTIKYCAMSLVGFIALPVVYLLIVRPGGDIAGGVAMGVFLILISVVVAATATVLEGILQSALDAKSTNDPRVKKIIRREYHLCSNLFRTRGVCGGLNPPSYSHRNLWRF